MRQCKHFIGTMRLHHLCSILSILLRMAVFSASVIGSLYANAAGVQIDSAEGPAKAGGGASGVQSARAEMQIGADDIGGTVTSANGTEAGVWVIAETQDFKTRFAKIVVTDEAGRYLIPDLPSAKYRVWVRGYGLNDSRKVDAPLGHRLDLAVTAAPSAAEAAKIYPAVYWYALMRIPEAAETAKLLGGRNGYLMWMKSMGCIGCHQLGISGHVRSRRTWARSSHRKMRGCGVSNPDRPANR